MSATATSADGGAGRPVGEPGRVLNLAAFAAALFLALFGLGLLIGGKALVGYDAHAYWSAWRGGLYAPGSILIGGDAYVYSPAFAQAIWPLTLLPFWAFRLLDSGACLLAVAWLLAPLPWRFRLPLFVACAPAIAMGNIQVILFAAAVAGLRHASVWALPILSKVTPGAGLLWFVGRRDWRRLAVGLSVSALIAAVSFVTAPDLWARWVSVLELNAAQHGSDMFLPGYLPAVPLVVRTAMAGLLVIWGGWSDRPWTVVVAVTLAQPDAGLDTLILLAAALPRTIIRPANGRGARDRAAATAVAPLLSSGA